MNSEIKQLLRQFQVYFEGNSLQNVLIVDRYDELMEKDPESRTEFKDKLLQLLTTTTIHSGDTQNYAEYRLAETRTKDETISSTLRDLHRPQVDLHERDFYDLDNLILESQYSDDFESVSEYNLSMQEEFERQGYIRIPSSPVLSAAVSIPVSESDDSLIITLQQQEQPETVDVVKKKNKKKNRRKKNKKKTKGVEDSENLKQTENVQNQMDKENIISENTPSNVIPSENEAAEVDSKSHENPLTLFLTQHNLDTWKILQTPSLSHELSTFLQRR